VYSHLTFNILDYLLKDFVGLFDFSINLKTHRRPDMSKYSLDWVKCKPCGEVLMGLLFTLGTGIFNTFMFRLLVSLRNLCVVV
jgi:hypothetical protein